MTDQLDPLALRERMSDWQESYTAATEALRAVLADHPKSALLVKLLATMQAAHDELLTLAGTLADAYAESRDELDRLLPNIQRMLSEIRDELTPTERKTP